MQTMTITNPKTGRPVRVKAWLINPREVYERCRSGEYRTARDISWALLNDDESIQLMEDTEYGDSAHNNWALQVFEQALDWTLGLVVLDAIDSCIRRWHKLPKPFYVAVQRNGNVYVIVRNSGRVILAHSA